jgi:hypothetical protein
MIAVKTTNRFLSCQLAQANWTLFVLMPSLFIGLMADVKYLLMPVFKLLVLLVVGIQAQIWQSDVNYVDWLAIVPNYLILRTTNTY